VNAADAPEARSSENAPAGPTVEEAAGGGLSEEQLRAAYEEELRRMTSSDLMLQAAVSLINLAGRRLGPPSGGGAEGSQPGELRDLEQVRDAIDAVRALVGVLERRVPKELGPLRDALSQLQLAYAREAQAGSGAREDLGGDKTEPDRDPSRGGDQQGSAGDPEQPRGPGPAESSGRLWVPDR
jgi:hypothetical protein